jgi:hypothetical protein
MLRRWRARRGHPDHDRVRRQLDKQEQDYIDLDRRVRILELEAGIFRPEPKEANGS